MKRILIKGASGSGKSTLGRILSQRLHLPLVELDALFHGPNWTSPSPEVFAERVTAALDDARGWVVDGNYDAALGDIVIGRADLVVWLDLPLHVKLTRLARRSARRYLTQEELWNGNRENLREIFWGTKALLPWTVRCHFTHRQAFPQLLARKIVVRLRSRRGVEAWLKAISQT